MQKKGSEQARLNAQFQEKAEKKKSLAVNALLASVYKDLGKKKGDGKEHFTQIKSTNQIARKKKPRSRLQS